jgi:two-component system response regulator AtoC
MGDNAPTILVVDDDPQLCWVVREGLTDEGYHVITADSGTQALEKVRADAPDVVFLDFRMSDLDGLETLQRIKEIDGATDVIMISGFGKTRTVVRAMQLGASDFVNKPFEIDDLKIVLSNVLHRKALTRELSQLRTEIGARGIDESIIGDSPRLRDVKRAVEQVADSGLTVLIRGESGTGKELAARALHRLSRRADKPFIKVNCAALPGELLEAELFGYERGAFTSAYHTKPGRFEYAHHGTIFLDEIGEVPIELQSKLLQALEQREFMRLGGKKTIRVDVRIVASTNRDLQQAMASRRFREDLYYRINEVAIEMPPLRERPEDIPLLVDHFLRTYGDQYGKRLEFPSKRTMALLLAHTWPGNVRELESVVKKMIVFGSEEVAGETLGGPSPAPACGSSDEGVTARGDGPGSTFSLKEVSRRAAIAAEVPLIREALRRTNWNRRVAAGLLGISYRSLLDKIKEYGITSLE